MRLKIIEKMRKKMALETLKEIDSINGFKIIREKPTEMTWDYFDEYRKKHPILITDEKNMISFRLQNGSIKSVGVNGCQVDTLIETARLIIFAFNQNYPCRENSIALTKLDESLHWLEARKRDREKRGVEGFVRI